MSGCPVFILTTEDGELLSLVDDNQVGNAIPTRQTFGDLDVRQDYVTGDSGVNPIRLPHEFLLSMDYVTQEVREKLLEWKYARKRVTLADPLVTANTVFAWRPVYLNGSLNSEGAAATDLTGNHPMQYVGDNSRHIFWDKFTSKIIGAGADGITPFLDTEYGVGQFMARKDLNRVSNPHPLGATQGHGAGRLGWYLGDGDSIADIEFISQGFDIPQSLNSFRVYTNGGAGFMDLTQGAYFDPTAGDYGGWVPPNNSGVWGTIWIKGQVAKDTVLHFGPTQAPELVDIGGMNFDTWTRLDIGSHYAFYPELDFQLLMNVEDGERVDFQVGASMVTIEHDTVSPDYAQYGGPGPLTMDTTGDPSTTVRPQMISSGFTPPVTGTVAAMFSFNLEAGHIFRNDIYDNFRMGLFQLPPAAGGSFGSQQNACYIRQRPEPSEGQYQVVVVTGGSSKTFEFDIEWFKKVGPFYTVVVSYGEQTIRAYINGVEIHDSSNSPGSMAVDTGNLTFCGVNGGCYGSCCAVWHGFSYAAGVASSGQVQAFTGMMSDTVARNLYNTTRGRLYEIVSVPSGVLIQDGYTRWLGDIRLRQVKYTGTDVAWFATEPVS